MKRIGTYKAFREMLAKGYLKREINGYIRQMKRPKTAGMVAVWERITQVGIQKTIEELRANLPSASTIQ